MSADIMPCGCLGHADNEDLCEYPKLEAEADGFRTKLTQAQAELDELKPLYRLALAVAEKGSEQVAQLEEKLQEREQDMHMRIRLGYDKVVADAWRAKVEELEGRYTDLCDLIMAQFPKLASQTSDIEELIKFVAAEANGGKLP